MPSITIHTERFGTHSLTHSAESKKKASYRPTMLGCLLSERMSISTMKSSSSVSSWMGTLFSAARMPDSRFSACVGFRRKESCQVLWILIQIVLKCIYALKVDLDCIREQLLHESVSKIMHPRLTPMLKCGTLWHHKIIDTHKILILIIETNLSRFGCQISNFMSG